MGDRQPFRGVCHPTAPSEKTMLEVYHYVPPGPEKKFLKPKPLPCVPKHRPKFSARAVLALRAAG